MYVYLYMSVYIYFNVYFFAYTPHMNQQAKLKKKLKKINNFI